MKKKNEIEKKFKISNYKNSLTVNREVEIQIVPSLIRSTTERKLESIQEPKFTILSLSNHLPKGLKCSVLKDEEGNDFISVSGIPLETSPARRKTDSPDKHFISFKVRREDWEEEHTSKFQVDLARITFQFDGLYADTFAGVLSQGRSPEGFSPVSLNELLQMQVESNTEYNKFVKLIRTAQFLAFKCVTDAFESYAKTYPDDVPTYSPRYGGKNMEQDAAHVKPKILEILKMNTRTRKDKEKVFSLLQKWAQETPRRKKLWEQCVQEREEFRKATECLKDVLLSRKNQSSKKADKLKLAASGREGKIALIKQELGKSGFVCESIKVPAFFTNIDLFYDEFEPRVNDFWKKVGKTGSWKDLEYMNTPKYRGNEIDKIETILIQKRMKDRRSKTESYFQCFPSTLQEVREAMILASQRVENHSLQYGGKIAMSAPPEIAKALGMTLSQVNRVQKFRKTLSKSELKTPVKERHPGRAELFLGKTKDGKVRTISLRRCAFNINDKRPIPKDGRLGLIKLIGRKDRSSGEFKFSLLLTYAYTPECQKKASDYISVARPTSKTIMPPLVGNGSHVPVACVTGKNIFDVLTIPLSHMPEGRKKCNSGLFIRWCRKWDGSKKSLNKKKISTTEVCHNDRSHGTFCARFVLADPEVNKLEYDELATKVLEMGNPHKFRVLANKENMEVFRRILDDKIQKNISEFEAGWELDRKWFVSTEKHPLDALSVKIRDFMIKKIVEPKDKQKKSEEVNFPKEGGLVYLFNLCLEWELQNSKHLAMVKLTTVDMTELKKMTASQSKYYEMREAFRDFRQKEMASQVVKKAKDLGVGIRLEDADFAGEVKKTIQALKAVRLKLQKFGESDLTKEEKALQADLIKERNRLKKNMEEIKAANRSGFFSKIEQIAIRMGVGLVKFKSHEKEERAVA